MRAGEGGRPAHRLRAGRARAAPAGHDVRLAAGPQLRDGARQPAAGRAEGGAGRGVRLAAGGPGAGGWRRCSGRRPECCWRSTRRSTFGAAGVRDGCGCDNAASGGRALGGSDAGRACTSRAGSVTCCRGEGAKRGRSRHGLVEPGGRTAAVAGVAGDGQAFVHLRRHPDERAPDAVEETGEPASGRHGHAAEPCRDERPAAHGAGGAVQRLQPGVPALPDRFRHDGAPARHDVHGHLPEDSGRVGRRAGDHDPRTAGASRSSTGTCPA